MNWNEIEHLINEHKSVFNDQEPLPDHQKRFEKKLHNHFGQGREKKKNYFLKIAASIAILIVSSTFIVYLCFHSQRHTNQSMIITEAMVELGETEDFYAGQIKSEMEQLEKLQLPETTQKEIILKELGAMDENYQQLKRELKSNPSDDRLIHAIIELYQVKLEAINHIINSVSYSEMYQKKQNHEQNI
jgi:hypothetical protein